MKANRKLKLDNSGATYTAVIAGLVALLLTIVIGVMLYFEVTDSVDQFDEVTETFTGYTRYNHGAGTGSNKTGVTITLDNSPYSSSVTNVTCWNASGTSAYNRQSYPSFGLNHKTISIAADAARNFTQVNVTYTSNIAQAEGSDVTPMAQTVFALAPIIALVVVAAIIIGIVILFGGGRRGKL